MISDFHVEQALSHVTAQGRPDLPPGRITLQQPKVHLNGDAPVLIIDGYRGRVAVFPAQLHCRPEKELFSGTPGQPFGLLVAGAYFYRTKPVFSPAGENVRIALVGNVGARDVGGNAGGLVRAALDDLRRLGEMDSQWPDSAALISADLPGKN